MSTAEIYRTPDHRFENLPGYDFAPNYVDVDGLRMHYLDEGPRDGAPIVCFHGEPSWAYLYRKMIPPLVQAGHRVVVPDLAGFGRSDKPTDRRWHTLNRHSGLVDAVLGTLNLHDATVVVQDWGGPIGLRWAMEHQQQVAALAIFNTILSVGQMPDGFFAWREFAEANPDLPVGAVIQSGTATELPADVVAAYDAPFPTAESKAGPAEFPLLVPITEDSVGVTEMEGVIDALSRWHKPALVAFSDQDLIFPFPQSGRAFTDLIPTATEQVRIGDASHFLQEDQGERLADEVLKLIV